MTAVPSADLVVVGAGPAGAATALGALHEEPTLRVALLDRSTFPRDKACGDGVAPHVLDLLATVGVAGLLDDQVPVARLSLAQGTARVERTMPRPAYVVPRALLDHRLHAAAVAAGAVPVHRRVRRVDHQVDAVVLDGELRAPLLVGADGAHSVVARLVGRRPGPRAVALRGYAPTPPERVGVQVITFGTDRQPSYAWSFDRGDGYANVGYGELLGRRERPTRALLEHRLDELLPGAGVDGSQWRGHPLPLSTARPLRPAAGRVLLVGDAAGLVNPLTGEGIYYAVATGLLAGRAAARALREGRPDRAARDYARATRRLLAGHLRHTALAARLTRHDRLLASALRATAADQGVFDDLVELGLARGRITPRVLRGIVRGGLERVSAGASTSSTTGSVVEVRAERASKPPVSRPRSDQTASAPSEGR